MFKKKPESPSYVILFVIIVIALFAIMHSEHRLNNELKKFRALTLDEILSVSFYRYKNKITFKDIDKISEILPLFKNNNIIAYKEKRMYPISLNCEFVTKKNNIYRFDIFKDNNSEILFIFLRTEGSSVFLNGIDQERIIDEINKGVSMNLPQFDGHSK